MLYEDRYNFRGICRWQDLKAVDRPYT